MTKRRSSEDMTGSTFSDLYDIQQELSRQGNKTMGRPRNKVQRKPTTIYLTKEEKTMLRRLHLTMVEHLSVNHSQIVGIAIEMLNSVLAQEQDDTVLDNVKDIEDIKKRLKILLQL